MMKEIGSFINSKKEAPAFNNPSHLKEGVKPIRACIGKPEEFDQTKPQLYKQFLEGLERKVYSDNVNFEGDINFFKRNFKHDIDYSYLISQVNGYNIISEKYRNCIGMVVAGRKKKAMSEISFLTHAYGAKILNKPDKTNAFKHDLNLTLNEIKCRSIERSIDAVIFGGYYFNNSPDIQEEYINFIKLLSTAVQNNLGFEPFVIKGPKNGTTESGDTVFYKNKERKLYIESYYIDNASTNSYYPSDIGEQREKWK